MERTSIRSACIPVVHTLHDAAVPLRIVFGICLIGVFFAGIYVFRKRKTLFGQDPHVTTDTWPLAI
jgi:hypothetical protein